MQRQDKALGNLVWRERCPCCEQEVGLDASQGSFQLELSYDTKSFLKWVGLNAKIMTHENFTVLNFFC